MNQNALETEASGANAKIFSFEASYVYPPQRQGFRDIRDRVADLESDRERAILLVRARQQLAEELAPRPNGLAALRLRRGMSQVQLAALMESSQPKVSRIEAGLDDVRHSTLKKLASALGATIEEVSAALDFSRERTVSDD